MLKTTAKEAKNNFPDRYILCYDNIVNLCITEGLYKEVNCFLNFIFDVGNVLVDYMPLIYLRGLFNDESFAQKMYESIFKSPEWLMMDEGLLTHVEATERFIAREPEFESEICQVMERVNEMFIPKLETIELLPRLKGLGHGVYYLSNIHYEIRDFLLENHDYFGLFDGGVFSCDINKVKPSPEIYRHLIRKYDLIPKDCVFFDDMEENVAAADREGIKGVLFTTADCVLGFI